MKIGLVSTYPPRNCGIAVYSSRLVEALLQSDPKLEICVVAERGAQDERGERLEVRASYEREGDFAPHILEAAQASKVDLLHIQYAPELFGEDDRMPNLAEALRSAGIKVVITMHTVRGARWHRILTFSKPTAHFHRRLGEAVTLVVHHESNAQTLHAHGIQPKQVKVIPHGTTRMEPVSKNLAREQLALPKKGIIFLFFGFVHAQKNLHTAVEAFRRVYKKHRDVYFAMAGGTQEGKWYNELYARFLRWRLKGAIVNGRAFWRQEFVPHEAVPAYYAAADAVLLPHAFQSYGSVSGIFHQAIGANRPVICSKSNKFKEVMDHMGEDSGIFVRPTSVSQWARAMVKMAEDDAFRNAVQDKLAAYSEQTLWPAVAQKHLDLYKSL